MLRMYERKNVFSEIKIRFLTALDLIRSHNRDCSLLAHIFELPSNTNTITARKHRSNYSIFTSPWPLLDMTSLVTATVQVEKENNNKVTGHNDRLANGINVGTNYRLLSIDKVHPQYKKGKF